MARAWVAAALLLAACGGRSAPASTGGVTPAAADKTPAWFAPEALAADVAWLCDRARAGRGAYQPGGRAAADWFAARFAELGLEVQRQPIPGGSENVFGLLRGDDRAVVVSAHYDHLGDQEGTVYPGADDNASGAAVLLALARDAARGPRPRHTLLFAAFGAEELGLLGSGEYVNRPVWPLARTLAVINFDMVGRNFFEAGAAQPATAAVIGLETLDGARAVAEEAAAAAGLKIVPAPAGLLEVFGYANRTDDWWFRRRGVPAIHFSTGMHDDYHQPTDTPERLVPAQLARVARTAAALVRWLGARP